MANELRIADQTGLTYTCEVRQTDGTLIGSAVSLAESGSTGRYYGDFPSGSASSGTEYDLIYIQDSTIEATERRYWNGTKLLGFEDALTTADIDARIAAAEPIDANITSVTGTGVTDVTDFQGGGGGATASEIADAVWDEATADHTTAGTFGLLISTVATAAAVAQAVWEYATRTLTSSAAQTNNAVSGADLAVTRGVTFTHTFTGNIPATWARVIFTAKAKDCDNESAAIVQVLATNPADAGDGLQRLEGDAATASQATITVDDASDTAQLTIHDDATAQMWLRAATEGAEYDCKLILADSTSSLLDSGTFSVESTPTWTT